MADGRDPRHIAALGPLHLVAGTVFLAAGLWLAWGAAGGMPLDRLMPVLLGIVALISLFDGAVYLIRRRNRR